MHDLDISADELVMRVLALPARFHLCLLDSCGVSHLNSHLLVAGIAPTEIVEFSGRDAERTLSALDEKISQPGVASIFTLSYDFGLKLNDIRSRHPARGEPDAYAASFDVLIVHDYDTGKSYLTGNEKRFAEIAALIRTAPGHVVDEPSGRAQISSNFTRAEYLAAVEQIREHIRAGDTYQTNLTQQIRAVLPAGVTPETIFGALRKSHPAPFASFIRRKNDVVISASPERFFKVEHGIITTSPIKGTRPRGRDEAEDSALRSELLSSEKDRAENVMIVDLLRNDIGRICEFGSVQVEKLFDLEEHPTLFHLVSTVSGRLRENTRFSDLLRAAFPCGSITGAPKIRTMRIIDRIEPDPRGLSMGAVGFGISDRGFRIGSEKEENADSRRSTLDAPLSTLQSLDLSVAIRTMVVRGNEAVFNVGGGIVIDSESDSEYEETLTKARALLAAINADARDLAESHSPTNS